MRLKIAAISCTVFSVLLSVCWPLFVVPPASLKTASKHVQASFLLRAGTYIMVLPIAWFVAVLLSWLLYRRTREEYRVKTLENLKELLEGTLQDHGRKQG